jgi:hypothetical protein
MTALRAEGIDAIPTPYLLEQRMYFNQGKVPP